MSVKNYVREKVGPIKYVLLPVGHIRISAFRDPNFTVLTEFFCNDSYKVTDGTKTRLRYSMEYFWKEALLPLLWPKRRRLAEIFTAVSSDHSVRSVWVTQVLEAECLKKTLISIGTKVKGERSELLLQACQGIVWPFQHIPCRKIYFNFQKLSETLNLFWTLYNL